MKKGIVVTTAFDKYTVIKEVGSGGNGHVFSAKNTANEFVAIKFVSRNVASDKLRRFKNEIFFCERHNHKNIVEILDRGNVVLDEGEYLFYVMPLYAETLRNKMKIGITPEQAIMIFTGLLEGLAFAHKLGTIHRDIKPENIMFKTNSYEPIICDFGIAHFAEEELYTVIETKRNDRMANFQYAAPEQRMRGGRSSAQTDIYAVALILNEMFTGEIPQAADYKTIASVAPEYKYMDDVFSQLFKQNAVDRLYPEGKILMEMKVRGDQYRREQEKQRLQSVIDESIIPESFNPVIINKEYKCGQLIFTFDRELPYEWFQIFKRGDLGSYSSAWGYGPEDLRREERCELCMPLHGHESPDTIKRIAAYVLEWIPKANARYSGYVMQKAKQEQREKELKRKAEIERLEQENTINAFLSQL